MFVPTNTYSVERVEPIEDLVNYRDKQGNEYVAVSIDFEKENWVNTLIQQYGLKRLCEMYPYQPMRVDKKTGLIVPINPCDYQAKATNLFHIIYHMKLDEAQEQSNYEPQNVMVSTPPQTYGFEAQTPPALSQVPEYSPKWKEAFHLNEEPPKYVDASLCNLVETDEDRKNKYGITNNGGSMISDDYPQEPLQNQHHPNQYRQPMMPQQQSYCYPQPQQQWTPPPVVPNPYIQAQQVGTWYNQPLYYQSPIVTVPESDNRPPKTQPEILNNTFDLLEEQSKRSIERDEANLRYATQINNQVRQQNPTMLDTQSHVDFANPESVSQLQGGMYVNPYYNNLNNPNIRQQQAQGIQHGIPTGNSIVNPFYKKQQQQRSGYVANGQSPWLAWKFHMIPLSEEEKRKGKGVTLSIVKRSELKEKSYKKPSEEKRVFKASIVKVYVVKDGDSVIKMTEDEYQDYMELNGGRVVTPDSGRYRFSKSIREHVLRLGKKIAIYDEILRDCLIDCMDDKEYDVDSFLTFVKIVGEKYERLKKAEQQHPDRNYRVPYRYKRLPMLINDPVSGNVGYSRKEDYQEKRIFKFDDGREIDFFKYDRHREINQDEYNAFYEQILYERDVEMKLMKFADMEKAANEEIELNTVDWRNPMDIRLHNSRVIEKERKDQYSIYRAAYKTRMTDEEFDNWWFNGNTASKKKERTDDDIIFEKEQARRALGEQRQMILQDLVPIDQNRLAQARLSGMAKAVHDFDEGWMDGCTSLMDFFDRLGYLDMKCHEITIQQQREESWRNIRANESKPAYHEQLRQLASKTTYDSKETVSAYQKPTYQDFLDSKEYDKVRSAFMDYCSNSMGVHYELKPIFKAG